MAKGKHIKFWQLAELIPPILARLLAKKSKNIPMSDFEIAKESGLSLDEIWLMSHMTSWVGIDVLKMRQFLVGCRVDFCDGNKMDVVRVYLFHRAPTFRYLRRSPEWKGKYEPLLMRYRKATKLKYTIP